MTDLSSLPLRDSLRGQSPYGAPQLDVPSMLNTNENTHPVPPQVAEAITARVATVAGGLNRYPDREFTELRERLATYLGHGIAPDQVWAGNGSNEVLQQILQAFAGPGRTLLSFLPSYSMYPLLAAGTDTAFVDGGRAADHTLSAEHAAEQVRRHRPHVVFLASPNNPTGTALGLETIEAVYAAQARNEDEDGHGAMVVVDESSKPSQGSLAPVPPALL